MNLLAIDTSTKHFSLAVSRKDKIVASRRIKLTGVLSSSIMPAIDAILKKAGVPLKRLDGFVVGLGPGSFTSLRVGLATVKALSFSTQKPIVGISSLDALALNAKDKDIANICAVCDAKRNLVYAAVYQKNHKGLKRKSKYLLTGIEDLLKRVKKDTLFVGDGVGLYGPKIKTAGARFSEKKDWYPRAKNLIQLGIKRFEAKKVDDINKLVPLYLYKKDCQVLRK